MLNVYQAKSKCALFRATWGTIIVELSHYTEETKSAPPLEMAPKGRAFDATWRGAPILEKI